jgi:Transcriptional regulator
MDIRQLQYLAALARERHFTRAARSCQVTQPTLSERIRQLELELDVAIVERGQRFHGFTPEGERVLKWAQVILDNWASLRQEIAAIKDEGTRVTGRLTLGVIPSALPIAASLVAAIRGTHPGVDAVVLSATSEEIVRQLEDYSIDAGISYLDNEAIDGLVAAPLYRESYALFVRDDHDLAGRATVSWAEAAAHPLALLTPNMQNRRIIDRAFQSADARPRAHVESNSLINLCASVRETGLATVLPEYVARTLSMDGISAIPLTDPGVAHTVGILAIDRKPMPPMVAMALETALTLDLTPKSSVTAS